MSKKKSEKWYSKNWVIITGLIILLFIIVMPGSTDKKETKPKDKPAAQAQQAPKEAPKPKATYEATVINYGAPDPATLTAVVKLKNTNNLEGKPACKVEASSATGTYHGWDSFDLERTVPAGGEDQFIGKLTITKEGSAYITDVTATCGV